MIERLVSQNMTGSVCDLLAGNVEALSLLHQADGLAVLSKIEETHLWRRFIAEAIE